MKIALYIAEGLEQVVLTPETDTEKAIVGKLSDSIRTLSVYRGEFYESYGGWTVKGNGVTSTIIVLRKPAEDA